MSANCGWIIPLCVVQFCVPLWNSFLSLSRIYTAFFFSFFFILSLKVFLNGISVEFLRGSYTQKSFMGFSSIWFGLRSVWVTHLFFGAHTTSKGALSFSQHYASCVDPGHGAMIKKWMEKEFNVYQMFWPWLWIFSTVSSSHKVCPDDLYSTHFICYT